MRKAVFAAVRAAVPGELQIRFKLREGEEEKEDEDAGKGWGLDGSPRTQLDINPIQLTDADWVEWGGKDGWRMLVAMVVAVHSTIRCGFCVESII